MKHNFIIILFIFHKYQPKMDSTPAAGAIGSKPAIGGPTAPQPTKIATPPLTGIGKFSFHFCFHVPK